MKTARRVDPTVVEIPIDEAYRGMKNGGTSSGKVAMPDPRNKRRNFGSLKRDLDRMLIQYCVKDT